MSISPITYPRVIHANRFARNGQIPDAWFLNQLVGAQNHILSYRRKTFFRWGDLEAPMAGAAGPTNIWRFRCHTGHAASHFGLLVGLGRSDKAAGGSPYLKFTVTGGSGGDVSIYGGASFIAPTDAPSEIVWRTATLACDANTAHECVISTADFSRPVSVCVYEIASPVIDGAVDYFHALAPAISEPAYDSIRQRTLQGLSQIWRHNGSHLITWAGSGTGTNPTYASTTWTNVIDGATSVTSATPGYYLGDGDITLEPWVRFSDTSAASIDVVLAAHCSVTGSATGEVRLQNSGGTVASITGMGTAAAWYTTTTTISGVDAIDKLDLQCRTSNGANTVTLNAVSLYCYLA